MFKDRDAQLRRLEEALLEEEEESPELTEEVPEDEDLLTDDVLDELLEDAAPTQNHVPYQNFSNDYGNAYNADASDVDLDEYADQLQQPARKDRSGLVILACLLALGVLGVVIFLMLRQGGFL